MAKLLRVMIRLVLLVGLLPMSNHMSFMLVLHIDNKTISEMTVSQISEASGNVNDTSPEPCCDSISSLSMSCDFTTSLSGYVLECGGNQQVIKSTPIVQSIDIEAVIPPPKA